MSEVWTRCAGSRASWEDPRAGQCQSVSTWLPAGSHKEILSLWLPPLGLGVLGGAKLHTSADFQQHQAFYYVQSGILWLWFASLMTNDAEWYSVYVYITFIDSFTDTYLGWVHFFIIMNNVTVTMGVQITVHIPAFSSFRYMSRSKATVSCGNSVFNFWGTAIPFSTVVAPFYIPTSSIHTLQFPYISVDTCYLCFWL